MNSCRKDVYILGIKYIQSAAAITKNGVLLAHAREERFDRNKFSDSFPSKAIDYCLSVAGVTIDMIDAVAIAWNPGHELEPAESSKLGSRQYKHMLHRVPENLLQHVPGTRDNKSVNGISQQLLLNDTDLNIHYIPHHLCHTSTAYYQSGFDNAVAIALDAVGDDTCIEMHSINGTDIQTINSIKYPFSLGYLYAAFTQYLGYRANSDEWKVMGLSPYGKLKYYDQFSKLFSFNKLTGELEIDLSYYDYYKCSSRRYSRKFEALFGPERVEDDNITQYHMDLACSFQTRVEDIVIDMCNYMYDKTTVPNLCITGGVAMNSKMNGRISSETKFSNIYIPAMADDGGTAVGACYYYWYNMLHKPYIPEVLSHDYYGPGYSDDDIKSVIDSCKVKYSKPKNLFKSAASSLAKGKIVGWFQGRMETGNRALGNRSILADPRAVGMKDKINTAVKHREWYRPFAPAIMKEFQSEFFNTDIDSRYMQYVFPVRPEMQSKIPACVHVDGTGRLQTVCKNTNFKFHSLIEEFYKLTGVPVLLNTSFNDSEPIVCTPEQAIRTFYGTGLDELYIGPFRIVK